MAIKQEIIDELLANYKNPEDLLGDEGIFKQLKKALLERASVADQNLLGKMSIESQATLFQRASVTEQNSMLQRLTRDEAATLYGKASVNWQIVTHLFSTLRSASMYLVLAFAVHQL